MGVVGYVLTSGHEESHSVVVIHSYDSLKYHSQQLTKHTDLAFEKEGVNADIHHIYLSTQRHDSAYVANVVLSKCVSEMKRLNPKVVIVHDDYALDVILHSGNRELKRVPIVYAGVNVKCEEKMKDFPMMTGFMHRIKLAQNLQLAMRYWHDYNNPTIELDRSHLDVELLKHFQQTVFTDPKYIDNSDFHMKSLSTTTLGMPKYADKVVVSFISSASPDVNRPSDQSEEVGYFNLNSIYTFAKYMNQVQVTYNIASNSIIDHNRLPQFTAINEQFGDPNYTRFLCGYFPSVQTQCEDAVRYAVAIIHGASPQTLHENEHECSYYMDYNALSAYEGMELSDGSKVNFENEAANKTYNFKFVNAPFGKENKVTEILIFSAIVLIVSAIVALMVFRLYRGTEGDKTDTLDRLKSEREKFTLALLGSHATIWYARVARGLLTLNSEFCKKVGLPKNVFTYAEFIPFVHEDSLPSLETWRKDLADGVVGQRKLRLQMTFDGGNTYHWWNVNYNNTQESVNSGFVGGIMNDIDAVKKREDELEEARRKVYEVEMKETFLASISHDIRTPLNAVTGFAQVLVENYDAFGPEERKEFADIISNNSDVMLNLLLDVLNRSGRNITEIKFKPRPKSINEVVKMSYTTNHIITPSHLYLKLDVPEGEEDKMVYIDPKRVEQVINNFLSNAFKFTPQGGITLGWRFLEESDEVEVFVEDTGIGIDEDTQLKLFDRYYKVDEQANGTGLGLDICKTIIEKQGGTIGVTSKKGKGSRFYFRLKQYREEVAND